MFATSWFLTLFASSFPFDLVTRVFDVLWFEGWDVVYRVAIALLKVSVGGWRLWWIVFISVCLLSLAWCVCVI